MFILKLIVLLLIWFHKFNFLKCEGISSILFPFNVVADQSLENKSSNRNSSLRNRYQPSYSSTNTDYKSQYVNTNRLNKLSLDNRQNLKSSNSDRVIMPHDLYCEKDEWLCNDKLRCISKAAVCNKVQDCIDSSDELACIGNCRGDEFKCKNFKCIDEKYICDSFDDCGDWSDELNCIGTGKIPKLTGNLKLDLDSFESIENQNFILNTPQPEVSEIYSNHPNKHPDTFNSQLNKQLNNKIEKFQNNSEKYSNRSGLAHNQSATTQMPITITPQRKNDSNKKGKPKLSFNRSMNSGIDKTKLKSNESKKFSINYEAPYVKIFPLTPVIKNDKNISPDKIAFDNYAILSNEPSNFTNKNLIQNLESGKGNNKSPHDMMKLGENRKIENKLPISIYQKTDAQALTSQELINDQKNYLKKQNNKAKMTNHKLQVTNHTLIDVSKSNSDGQRLAFSISLPNNTEMIATNRGHDDQKSKSKGSKDENSKKLNCKRLVNQKIDDPNLEACKHCSYGLFRCLLGKCVITSFECGINSTNISKGRRVTVNVKDFLQFV